MLGYVAYIAVKYLAYASWCFVGLRTLAPERPRPFRRAALLGGLRFLLGVALGLFIFIAALTMNNATRNAPLTYLAIYVPVRVVEWALLHLLVATRFPWMEIDRLGAGGDRGLLLGGYPDRHHGGGRGAGRKTILLGLAAASSSGSSRPQVTTD